jgi:hypothetical protein
MKDILCKLMAEFETWYYSINSSTDVQGVSGIFRNLGKGWARKAMKPLEIFG